MRSMFFKLLAVVLVAVAALLSESQAAFIVPDSATAPFGDWTRGVTTNSVYAGFDFFTQAYLSTNSPDVGSWPVSPDPTPLGSDVTVTQNMAGAFLTGGGNIYSFSVATDFTVDIPGHSYGSGWNTRVVAQVRTLGTEIAPGSIGLIYNDGVDDVEIGSTYTAELERISLGGFGGTQVDTMYVFDIPGFNAESFSFGFTASGSSLSLDRLAVDTFTTQSALSPVPEPSTMALLAIGLSGVACRWWKRRNRVA
ncbi:MAG: PEP-CTERM sorting domain-containing protein [Planctomycetota bacterium]|nr:PEP-CTERM sorting domain-containing protein [Planctomycetota bacterium]